MEGPKLVSLASTLVVTCAALAGGSAFPVPRDDPPRQEDPVAQEDRSGTHFRNRSAGSGLDAVTWSGGPDKDHILESAGNGLLVFDPDGDGWDDLYLVSAWRFDESGGHEVHSARLYRNGRDLRFAEVTAAAGVTTSGFGSGGCAGDFDGDGLVDIYVTALGRDTLWRNNGDGTFSDVTDSTGIDAPGWSTGAVFFDADGDGDQDLYVAAYIRTSVAEAQTAVRHRMWRGRVPVLDGPRGLPGDRDLFFRNEGNGTFTEASAEAGLDDRTAGYGFGVVAFDADEDGDEDLYVANDSQANVLYENLGDGTFREATLVSGLGFDANGVEQGSMGVSVDDYDGDGRADVVVTNFANDAYTLYRNLGDGMFLDVSFETGVAVPTFTPLGWGAFFVDVDLDADLDLFFANGHLYVQVDEDPALGETYGQPNQLLINEAGAFAEAPAAGGLAVRKSSRGAAWGDLDRDGDPDIVISNQDSTPTLLENVADRAGGWVSFRLTDTRGDRMATGARVELVADARRQVRWVRSGDSYMSQSSQHLHFGLGSTTATVNARVVWPDGHAEEHEGLRADTHWVLARGREPIARVSR